VGQEHLPGAVSLDPLRGRRSSKVLVARNRLLKSTFRARPRVAADTIVQSLSGDADAPADCATRKACKCKAFSRAAEGIRTLDLLHGKQNVHSPFGADIPCKPMGSRVWVSFCDSPAFPGSSRAFRHRRGTRALASSPRGAPRRVGVPPHCRDRVFAVRRAECTLDRSRTETAPNHCPK